MIYATRRQIIHLMERETKKKLKTTVGSEQPADRPTNTYGDAFLATNSTAVLQTLMPMQNGVKLGCTV